MDETLTAALATLHDEYATAVNTAVAEDRDDLIDQLADEFAVAALELITQGA